MKKLILAFMLLFVFAISQAQSSYQTMYNASASATETVTNGGTGVLSTTTAAIGDKLTKVTIQVFITETSGVTAGTLTLQGSLNGTDWVALTDATAVPAIATKTATDVASQTFHWVLNHNPMRFYRISWTGSGTMVDTFTAKAWFHN